MTLATSDGYPVLDTNEEPIVLGEEYDVANITINESGELCYPDEKGLATPIGDSDRNSTV